jgi:hypothetical protein
VASSIGVEEVIRARRILIHAFLDQPHPEQAGVEVDVLLRIAGDARDVMESG